MENKLGELVHMAFVVNTLLLDVSRIAIYNRPSSPFTLTLYTTAFENEPRITLIFCKSRNPVDCAYDCTIALKLAEEELTVTDKPTVYDKFSPTVNVSVPLRTGLIVTDAV
jgi:hypothetical protein